MLCWGPGFSRTMLLDSALHCALEADVYGTVRLLSYLCLHFRVQSVGTPSRTQVPVGVCDPGHLAPLLWAVSSQHTCSSLCPASSPHTWPLSWFRILFRTTLGAPVCPCGWCPSGKCCLHHMVLLLPLSHVPSPLLFFKACIPP